MLELKGFLDRFARCKQYNMVSGCPMWPKRLCHVSQLCPGSFVLKLNYGFAPQVFMYDGADWPWPMAAFQDTLFVGVNRAGQHTGTPSRVSY